MLIVIASLTALFYASFSSLRRDEATALPSIAALYAANWASIAAGLVAAAKLSTPAGVRQSRSTRPVEVEIPNGIRPQASPKFV
jgi:hypothetical protein